MSDTSKDRCDRDDDGSLDDVVMENVDLVHIERMDDDSIWMCLTRGEEDVHLWFSGAVMGAPIQWRVGESNVPTFPHSLCPDSQHPADAPIPIEEIRDELRELVDAPENVQLVVDRLERCVDSLATHASGTGPREAGEALQATADEVVIWSGEHGAFWRADGKGYTDDHTQAGIYTRADAESRTSHCGPEKQIKIRPARFACHDGRISAPTR